MLLDDVEIFDEAAADPSLAEFADHAMRERFGQLVARFNAEGPIPVSKCEAAKGDFKLLVRHRLMVERDWKEHPEIAREEIRQPIFVVGMPRTGTTLLQCLLAQDRNNQILRYWHSHFPSPPPGNAPETVPGRIARADALVDEMLRLMPVMLPCHPYLDQGGRAELEDEELFTLDFQSAFPFHFLNVPSAPVGAAPTDPVAAFKFHKRMLQHFQWKGGAKRWVCKGTTHQFSLAALWEVYPDAICIWPHRNPADFMASTLEMISILYGPITGRDYRDFAHSLVSDMRAGYDYVLHSDAVNDPRLVHLPFPELNRDKIGAVRTIYERFNLPIDPAHADAMQRWLDASSNRPDRHGKFAYSLDTFGLTKAQIREQFRDYIDRFLQVSA